MPHSHTLLRLFSGTPPWSVGDVMPITCRTQQQRTKSDALNVAGQSGGESPGSKGGEVIMEHFHCKMMTHRN